MIDPRIARYRDIIAGMQKGVFDFELPIGPEDETGRLGAMLIELGRELKKQFDQFHRLCEITTQINAGLTLDEILDRIFESFKPLIPYDRMGFALLEEDGRLVRTRWARSNAAVMNIAPGYTAILEQSGLQRMWKRAGFIRNWSNSTR